MARSRKAPAPDPSKDPAKQTPEAGLSTEEIVQILAGYRSEAEMNRKSGKNPRDEIWEQNWDLYWGRYDFSKKAAWQSRLVMPEAQNNVDRWAAAMREALNQPGEWYEIEDEADVEGDLAPHLRKFMDFLLARCGRTQSGHEMDFSGVFEELVKVAAINAGCASVTAERDAKGLYVSVQAVDPRAIWLDATGRRLYRIRRTEIDKHELLKMAERKDSQGAPIYNIEEIRNLAAQVSGEGQDERDRSTGNQSDPTSVRKPIVLHEFLCTILDNEGMEGRENQLCILANDRFLIRGPEANPFWHKRDWIVFAPLVTVPFSVYGRSYMENWSSIARAFTEMTNLILDAAFTSAMKAYAVVPDMLEDPTEAAEGIHPNKMFQLAEGMSPKDFLKEIDLGELSPGAVTVWTSLKNEMREGAMLNDIALGQVPPKGDITATEVDAVSQAGSAMVRSMARSVESRLIEPLLELIWATGLQFTDFDDKKVVKALGQETAKMLKQRKAEFQAYSLSFQVRAISGLIDRAQKLRQLLSFLTTIGSNEILLREFLDRYDGAKVFDSLVKLFGVDSSTWTMTEREQMLRSLAETLAGQGQPGQPGQPQPGQGQSPSGTGAPAGGQNSAAIAQVKALMGGAA